MMNVRCTCPQPDCVPHTSRHHATIARIKAAFPGFSEEPLDPSNPRFASPGPVTRCEGCAWQDCLRCGCRCHAVTPC